MEIICVPAKILRVSAAQVRVLNLPPYPVSVQHLNPIFTAGMTQRIFTGQRYCYADIVVLSLKIEELQPQNTVSDTNTERIQ